MPQSKTKKTAKTKPAAVKTAPAKKRAATASAKSGQLDMTLALKAPLTDVQMRAMLKIGDTDRAMAARVAKLLVKHEAELAIPGVSSATMLASIRTTEAIAPSEKLAYTQAARLAGARLTADDATWRAIVKLHRRLSNEGSDTPDALSDFGFFMTYMANRNLKVEAPSHATTPPKPAPAARKPAKTSPQAAADAHDETTPGE